MHPIRRHILEQLILNSRLRFARLKPKGIESNHFLYYIKALTKEGMVIKEGALYGLSDAGKQWAGSISLQEDMSIRMQPKIMTAIVCIKDRQVLLQKRHKEPYFGKITLVNGKLHYGESVASAAARELLEKTGLKADLVHVGAVYLNFFENDVPVNHNLSHVFIGKNIKGELKPPAATEPFWAKLDSLDNLDLLEGTREILNVINEQPVFFREFKFSV